MRISPIGALALAASVVLWITPARPAEAQGLVPEEGAVELMLLRQESVQKELKLTSDETDRIHAFASKQWKRAQEIDKLGEQDRDRQFTEMTRENERFLDEVLEPAQRKRLNQIALQVTGLLWLTRKPVADELKLTDEQKSRARQFQQTARKEMQDLLKSTTPANRKEKLAELRETSRKRTTDLLTDEQETRWKQMLGHRFEGRFKFDPGEDAK